MDIKELKELIDFLKENGVAEFESNENGRQIKLSLIHGKPNYQFESEKKNFSDKPVMADTSFKEDESLVEEETFAVKSPIVGTFYSKSSPDSPAFIKVGDNVTKGQILCIIEAMKVMNEIESPVNGVIKEICVRDAEIVEFDEVIFKIKEN